MFLQSSWRGASLNLTPYWRVPLKSNKHKLFFLFQLSTFPYFFSYAWFFIFIFKFKNTFFPFFHFFILFLLPHFFSLYFFYDRSSTRPSVTPTQPLLLSPTLCYSSSHQWHTAYTTHFHISHLCFSASMAEWRSFVRCLSLWFGSSH